VTATQVWLDDRLVDAAEARVSVFDHAFTVGDAVFETAKVTDGVPFAMRRHRARLRASAAALRLPEPDDALLVDAVTAVLAQPGVPAHARLRITYGGGEAPMGSGRGDAVPRLVVAVAAAATPSAAIDLVTVPWPRNERGATAGVKSTSYAENVVALAHAQERGADEALFLNTRGEVCEGTGTNVFVVLGDGDAGAEIVTPPLSSGCLAGVTRALVVEWCDVVERALSTDELAHAAEVFVTSSTRDVQPVSSVDGRALPAPGPRTTGVAARFAERAAADPDP
jgi:branched-chain amino acid aminotransferase